MDDVLGVIVQVAALVFVVSSMLAMGLSLTITQIVAPLKKLRLVVVALVLNFALAPLLVWAIQALLTVDEAGADVIAPDELDYAFDSTDVRATP